MTMVTTTKVSIIVSFHVVHRFSTTWELVDELRTCY